MKRFFRSCVFAIALALAGAATWQTPAAAQTSSFDDAQVGEIEQIMRAYLLEHPEILREVLTALEAKEDAERTARVAAAITEHREPLNDAPASMVLGNPDGDITLVEFFDYNCGYCRRAMPDLMALIETDKNLRVVLKEFPILSDDSVSVARASIAAGNQGRYLDFHSKMLASKGVNDEARALRTAEELGLDMVKFKSDMAATETESIIAEAKSLATTIGIEGTPAYVIGSTLVPGAIGLDGLREVIEQERATN